jgi:hypothetical protein
MIMSLPAVGTTISFSDLRSVFGGGTSISLSEYYSTGPYTTGVAGIPSSGALSLSGTFGGKSRPVVNTDNVLWAVRIESLPNGSTRVVSMNVLSDNSIVIGGHYSTSNIAFYNANNSVFTTVTATVLGGYFLARVNTTGNFVWATRVEGWAPTLNLVHSSTTIANDDIMLVTGNPVTSRYTPSRAYNVNNTFINATVSSTNPRGYIIRYNSSGTAIRMQHIANAAGNAHGITTLSNGNFVYQFSVTTNSGTFSILYPTGTLAVSYPLSQGNTSGLPDILLLCANASQVGQWYMYVAHLNTDQFVWRLSNGVTSGFAVAFVNNGTSPTIRNGDGTTQLLNAPIASHDAYILFASNTGITQWIVQVQGTTGRDDMYDVTITTGTPQYVIGCGVTAGGMSVRNTDGTTFSYTIATSNGFVVCVNMSGITQWVVRIAGGVPRSVCQVPGNRISVFSEFTTSATIYQPNTNTVAQTVNAGSVGAQNSFIAIFDLQGTLVSITTGSATSTVTARICKPVGTNNFAIAGGFSASSVSFGNFNTSNVTSISKTSTVTEAAFVSMYTM